ncbi:hypothetical protein C922_00641 [Plasmodium inui San Antonio 1]|uniref:Uncharacterized protein n=1 Tax=Plasmodium inui San Antonio 1 TaxID=1237626 RepID=W7AB37_9APIC|nr:hypothetical protein C922_00641 [Plasmodium inui San Antonio 1]EUD68950.1 hypothetical protein C922_00641 [Plasmodium inui San Antonio 1]
MPNDTRYYYDLINTKWWYFDTPSGGWRECKEEVATEEAPEEEVTAESAKNCEEKKSHKYEDYKNLDKWNEGNYKNHPQHVMNGKVETRKGRTLENKLHNYAYTPRKNSKPNSESSNAASNIKHYSFKSNIRQHKNGNLLEHNETYDDSYEDNGHGKYANGDAEENSYDESGGHYDESGGPYDESSGHYDESAGHYDESAEHYDESAGHYDESAGHYDESAGHYDESAGHYDESGGNYAESSGNYNEAGEHCDKNWGYYDEYGGYYDEYGGYYDTYGGYYDKNGLYYDGSGEYYEESGVNKGENEKYHDENRVCYDKNSHLYYGSEEHREASGEYCEESGESHNDKGYHHDDNDKRYYEDCSDNEKGITPKDEQGGRFEKGARKYFHNYYDKVTKDCAVSRGSLHLPGKTSNLRETNESSKVYNGEGKKSDDHGSDKSDKESEQSCNSSDKERTSYDDLMKDRAKKKKKSCQSISSSDSENSDKLSERINSLLNQSSRNLSQLCKNDSSAILENLLSRSFTRSDHLNSINTIEKSSEDGKDENKEANRLIKRKTKVNFDQMYRGENNGDKEQGGGGQVSHGLVNNAGQNADRSDKDNDTETNYVPFVRRATRKLTFKNQGGLAGCLKVFQEKKKELMSSTTSDVNDMEIKIANLKRRARELAQRYKTKNQTKGDQLKSDQIKTKFEELVFLVQKDKKQSNEKGKNLE